MRTPRLSRKGRDFYVYQEGGRTIELQIDTLSGHPQRVIYASTMVSTRNSTDSSCSLDLAEQRKIAERIADHLKAEGYSVEVED